MVGPRPGGPRRRARRPDALERSARPRTSRRVAAAVRRSHPARVARVGLRYRSHGPLGGGGWRNQEDCERHRPQAAGRTTRPGRRPDDAGHVRRLRVELGVEGHARCEQRRQVQRVRGALHGAGAQPRRARVRIPDPRRRSPPRWSAAEPPGRSAVRPFPTEREETPEAGRRVEPLHGDLPREWWRALVERRADRGIRSRHGADGFGPRGQQVPRDPGVRHAPQGAHCPSGPRGRSLFPQYQGSGPMKRRKFLKAASAAGIGLAAAEAQRKHAHGEQMGRQQRSGPSSIDIRQGIKGGAIEPAYPARAWYANTRGTIGRGKAAPVPGNLDYELWQGPAPRTPYHDNIIHYNWHWFRRWGTGEILNNGTHEIDVARWALGVGYPTRVTSVGGRYHYADDWEFPDTQEVCFEFADGKTIIWQGQSCNGLTTFGRSRGTAILGTAGSVVLDRDGYTMYDLKEKVMKSSLAA